MMFEEMEGEYAIDGEGQAAAKTRFKEEEDKVNLLKGIRD